MINCVNYTYQGKLKTEFETDKLIPEKLCFGNDMVISPITAHINRVKRQVEALTCQIEKAETYISQIKPNSQESVSKFKEEIESLEEYIKLKKKEKSQFSEQLKHFEIWLSQVEKELPCGESGNAKIQ